MPKDKKKSISDGGELFEVGLIVGVRGVKGELKVRPFTNNPELLLDITEVKVSMPREQILTSEVESIYLEKRLLFICLADVVNRDQSESLVGAKVEALRVEMRPLEEDEFWMRDLVGLEVFTTGGERVGKVVDVLESPGFTWKSRLTKTILQKPH